MASDNSKMGSNVIRVKLVKQKKYGLGFLVRPRSKPPYVVVSDLVDGGMAADSGLVQIGDVIVKVNDVSFEDMTYEKSLDALKSLPVNMPVVMILKGPEGYMSHLETRFNDEGVPKTVRVTKPILHSESIIDKIKKTLAVGNSSPKPCRTKQTQANCECQSDKNKSTPNGDIFPMLDQTDTDFVNYSTTDSNRNHTSGSPIALHGGCPVFSGPGQAAFSHDNKIGNQTATPNINTVSSGGEKTENRTNRTQTDELKMVQKTGADSNNTSPRGGGSPKDLNISVNGETTEGSPAKLNGAKMDGKIGSKGSPIKKFVKLRNVGNERPVSTDTLHCKAAEVSTFMNV